MKLVKDIAVVGALLASQQAHAAVVKFDDIPLTQVQGNRPYKYAQMPRNYGGINWDSPEWYVYGSEQYPYTPASGNNRLATNNNTTSVGFISFSFESPVTFNGMFFAGASTSTNLFFELFLKGQLVKTVQVGQPSPIATYFSSGYVGGVDRVSIYGSRGFYVIDDVTYEPIPRSAVPEPGTWAMLILGFGLIGYAMRRKTELRYV